MCYKNVTQRLRTVSWSDNSQRLCNQKEQTYRHQRQTAIPRGEVVKCVAQLLVVKIMIQNVN